VFVLTLEVKIASGVFLSLLEVKSASDVLLSVLEIKCASGVLLSLPELNSTSDVLLSLLELIMSSDIARARERRYRRRGRQCVLGHIGRKCASTLFKDSRFSRVGANAPRVAAAGKLWREGDKRDRHCGIPHRGSSVISKGEGTLSSCIRTDGQLANAACPRAAAQRPPISATVPRCDYPSFATCGGGDGDGVPVTPLYSPLHRPPVCSDTMRRAFLQTLGCAPPFARRDEYDAFRAITARLLACLPLPSLRRFSITLDVFEDTRDGIPKRVSPHRESVS